MKQQCTTHHTPAPAAFAPARVLFFFSLSCVSRSFFSLSACSAARFALFCRFEGGATVAGCAVVVELVALALLNAALLG